MIMIIIIISFFILHVNIGVLELRHVNIGVLELRSVDAWLAIYSLVSGMQGVH